MHTLTNLRSLLQEKYGHCLDIDRNRQGEVRKIIRQTFFLKIRAKRHIAAGFPLDEFHLTGVPWRDELRRKAIESYQAYIKGSKAKLQGASETDNPYQEKEFEYTSRGMLLEYCWKKGFDGEKFI